VVYSYFKATLEPDSPLQQSNILILEHFWFLVTKSVVAHSWALEDKI